MSEPLSRTAAVGTLVHDLATVTGPSLLYRRQRPAETSRSRQFAKEK